MTWAVEIDSPNHQFSSPKKKPAKQCSKRIQPQLVIDTLCFLKQKGGIFGGLFERFSN